MAKDTAKKNWRRNAARMNVFNIITIVVNFLYVCKIMYHNGGLPSFRDVLAIAFWAGQEYLALSTLTKYSQPTFSAEGELLDCVDASNPKELGYYSFVQDVLWVCWVVQALCAVHPAFIVFYLPVPATLIYQAWTKVVRPLLDARFGGAQGGEAGSGKGSNNSPLSRKERRREEINRRKGRHS